MPIPKKIDRLKKTPFSENDTFFGADSIYILLFSYTATALFSEKHLEYFQLAYSYVSSYSVF
jgi:hypothetical protein